MAIDAYVGKPGAGKSHGVVDSVILPSLKAGRRVVHNMPLVDDAIRAIEQAGELVKIPDGMSAADLVVWFREHHKGSILVYDEMWRLLPSGLKASAIPEDVRSFFAEHRHMSGQTIDGRSTDIVLVTQSLSQIAKFVVDLVEQTFLYYKRADFGFRNAYRCTVYSGAVTGDKPPESKKLNAYHGKYKPAIFACYKSHTMSATGAAAVEAKDDGRGSILKRPLVIAAAIALVLVIPAALLARHMFFAIGKPKGAAAAAERSDSRGGGVPQPPPPPKPAGPKYSEKWRYAGELTRHGRIIAVLDSSTGARYLPAGACPEDQAGNRSCVLDGEVITAWTGTPPRGVIDSFTTAAITPDSQLSTRP